MGLIVYFGEGVKIYDHNHIFNTKNVLIKNQGFFKNKIKIGNNCWFGSNVIILKNANIGSNCVVSAGSILNNELNSNCIQKKDNIEDILFKGE